MAPDGGTTEFRILGSLQVGVGTRLVRLSGLRQRQLLALLLLNPNRMVTVPYLVQAVWDGDPPSTAKRQIQNCISALRHRLADVDAYRPVIVADGPGYRIDVAAEHLDALAFDRQVASARTAAAQDAIEEAAGRLRLALRMWRGPALADVTGRVVEAAAARLDEQRLAAIEHCHDLELRLGRHEELVGELTELVVAQPLRERLASQLMVAQYRSGRQADALDTYRRWRARLVEERGLDPSPQLQQLHAAILRNEEPAYGADGPPAGVPATAGRPEAGGDPVDQDRVVPRQLPAVAPHFVGRRQELRTLDRLAAAADRVPAIVISAIGGTAGIGKTMTALHWANRAAGRFPDGQLYVNLRGFDPTGSVMAPAEAVRGFLDAFAIPPERIPADLDAQAALYRSLVAGRRLLVVLDNARDADQVRPLLPGSPGCLVLVTSRDQLMGLITTEGAHPVTLGLLTDAEAEELLARRLGPGRVAAEPLPVGEILAACAGLPLALAIVAARAAVYPDFALAALARQLREAAGGLEAFAGPDPATDVRTVFSWSYRTLSAEAARLFRLLGSHPGPDIAPPAAASLAGAPMHQVVPLLAELARANLVGEHAPNRFGLHDLLRAYAAELSHAVDSDDEADAALHRLLDHYLRTAYEAALLLDPLRNPIAVAPVGPGVTPEVLADRGQALAWLEAEHRVLAAAVERAAATGFDIHGWQLAWTLTTFLDRRGFWHDWAATQRIALAASTRLGDRDALARTRRSLGFVCSLLGRYEEARVHLSEALELCRASGDDAGEANTHLNLAKLSEVQGQEREALSHAQHALDLYVAAGDLAGQAHALNAAGWYEALVGNSAQALVHCQAALGIQRRLGDRHGSGYTLDSIGYAYHGLGDFGAAISYHRKAIDVWRDLGDLYEEATALVHLGDAQHAADDSAAAAAAWRLAADMYDQLGQPEAGPTREKLQHLHDAPR